MHFGDQPAVIGLDVAKKLVVEASRDIIAKLVEIIKHDYVDNGYRGGREKDIQHFMGEAVDKEGKDSYRGTVSQIMEHGGFKIKYMIRDRESQPGVLEKFGGSVLGIPWDTSSDVILTKPAINLSRKVQNLREGSAIPPYCLKEMDESALTMPVMTSQIYGLYDPLVLLHR